MAQLPNSCSPSHSGRTRLLRLAVTVGAVTALAGCGGSGGSAGPAAGTTTTGTAASTTATTTTVASPTTATSTTAGPVSAGLLPDLAAIQKAAGEKMATKGAKALSGQSALRALCGRPSSGSPATSGHFIQFDTVPANKALVVVAVQQWPAGTLDQTWQARAAQAENCVTFTQEGTQRMTVQNDTSDTRILLITRSMRSLVEVADELHRFGDVVVSVRTVWDGAAGTKINVVTKDAIVAASIAEAKAALG